MGKTEDMARAILGEGTMERVKEIAERDPDRLRDAIEELTMVSARARMGDEGPIRDLHMAAALFQALKSGPIKFDMADLLDFVMNNGEYRINTKVEGGAIVVTNVPKEKCQCGDDHERDPWVAEPPSGVVH